VALELLSNRATRTQHASKEIVVQKQMFKVLVHVDTKDGGFWSRIGSGFRNRDDSINLILYSLPLSGQIQLRELDEEDLRRRETYAARKNGGVPLPEPPPGLPPPPLPRSPEPIPF
jgi:hypothetical protein